MAKKKCKRPKKLLALGLFLCATSTFAADADLTWKNPTEWNDGALLAPEQIEELQIEWGRCTADSQFPPQFEGRAVAAGPVEAFTVKGLAANVLWCFRVAAVAEGQVSDWSNTATGIWIRKPKPPKLNGPSVQTGAMSVVIQ